jgi:HD-GYP domain-containing protein (c-di-GMP phosphodiesterase class II)
MPSTIAVEELRVGMYIHLDRGWLSHPFPLSSFRLTATEQIDTLRALGFKQVRWVPEKSQLTDTSTIGAGPALQATPPRAERPALTPMERLLAQQSADLQRCEAQYGEAAEALCSATAQLLTQPEQAGRAAEALSRGLLDKMVGPGEVCIRLLESTLGADDRSIAHALNVTVMSLLIGRAFGLPDDEMQDLGVGALLHDVGKLSLPERLRGGEERLDTDELNAYREHVLLGVAQGRRMQLSAGALTVIAQHHEAADGNGFPQRLHSDRMSTAARIVALVDVYDKLCNPSVPAHALTPHEAVAMLFAKGRTRFDAAILNAFIRMMGVYPAGSVVQLTDDRYAIVVGVNSSRPLKPRVLAFDAGVPKRQAAVVSLEQAKDLGIRRSLSPVQLPAAALEYFAPKARVSYYFEPASNEPAAQERQHHRAA